MDTYSFLRELADSWALLALFVFFIGVILWTVRPGSNKIHNDILDIPFRNEMGPADEDQTASGDDQTNTSGARSDKHE